MKRYIIYLTLGLVMSTFSAFGEIIQSTDLQKLAKILKTQDRDTLVIFDVDHVLIMPTEEYSLNRNPNRKPFWEEIKARLSKERIKFLHSLVTAHSKWQLVDNKIIDILNELKSRSLPAIALTSLGTGEHGVIPKREELRVQELKRFGIDFSKTCPFKGDELLLEFENFHGIPMLKEGIILTTEIDKAFILEQLFRKRNYFPKTIIFVDDLLKNVESLEKLCQKLGIKFIGFHYNAVSLMKSPEIDKDLEKVRFKILENEHKWLTYDELKKRVEKN
jgi:Protein of unknown function (DUF2608)